MTSALSNKAELGWAAMQTLLMFRSCKALGAYKSGPRCISRQLKEVQMAEDFLFSCAEQRDVEEIQAEKERNQKCWDLVCDCELGVGWKMIESGRYLRLAKELHPDVNKVQCSLCFMLSPFTVLCPCCAASCAFMCCRPQVMHFRECAKLTRWDAATLQHFVQSSLSRNYVLHKQFHIRRWFCHCIMEGLFGTICKRFVLFGRFFQTMLVGASMIVNLNGEPRRFDFLDWGLTASKDMFFSAAMLFLPLLLLLLLLSWVRIWYHWIQQSWHCKQIRGSQVHNISGDGQHGNRTAERQNGNRTACQQAECSGYQAWGAVPWWCICEMQHKQPCRRTRLNSKDQT